MVDDELIIEREKRWVKSLTPAQRKKPSIYFMDGRRFTPDQIIEEMEEDTPVGKVFKKAEAKMLERTLQKKKEAGLGV